MSPPAWRCCNPWVPKAERQGSDLFVAPGQDLRGEIPDYLAGAMRSSVFYLAPLLCRVGEVRLPLPGGCKLGPRPVDIHLAGLAAMGAQVELEGIAATLRRRGPLHGVDFALRLPSVGATMTLMMAATQAGGAQPSCAGPPASQKYATWRTFCVPAGRTLPGPVRRWW